MTLVEARMIAGVRDFEKRCRYIDGVKAYKNPSTEEYKQRQVLLEKADSYRTYLRIQVGGRGMYSAGWHVREILMPLGLMNLNEPWTNRCFLRDELFAFTAFGWEAHGARACKALLESNFREYVTVVALTGTPVYKDWRQVAINPEKIKFLTAEEVLSIL